nr:alcohol dehydrogenase catalytic domain-containing protein [Steroidobacter agaridevorans]
MCGTDLHIYHGKMDHRVHPPGIIGHEMSGTVAVLGESVKGFAVGDNVVVRPLDYCGSCPACTAGHSHVCHRLKFMGVDSTGALQSYWTVKARSLHRLPDNVDLKRGALVEPLAVACHDVARSRLRAGERAVVLGGGPIGQLIALVGKALGAHVLVSEPHALRRTYAADAGIEVFDPTGANLAEHVEAWTGSKGADVVFEVAGVPQTVQMMTKIAAVRGRICMVAIHSSQPPVDLFRFFWRELELLGARVYQAEDFDRAIELIASGQIPVDPLITSVRPLADVQRAFEMLDTGQAGMKTLLECRA